MPPRNGVLRGVCAGISLLIFSPAVFGGGYANPFQSARAAAMAGAIAAQRSPDALAYNVSSVAGIDSTQLILGVRLISIDSTFSNADDPQPEPNEDHLFVLPHVYGATPLGERLVVGLAIFEPWGLRVDNANDAQFSGRFISQDSSLSVIAVQPSIAYQSTGGHWSLGVGAAFCNSRLISMKNLPAPLAGPPIDVAHVRLKTDVSQGSFFTFGTTWSPNPRWSVAASHRTEMAVEYDGTATITQIATGDPALDAAVAASLPPTQPFQTKIRFPSSTRVAVARGQGPLAVEIDVEHERTSVHRSIDIAFEQTPTFDTSIVQDWRDAISVHAGMEYVAGPRWAFHSGLSYEQTPMPIETMTPIFADADRLGFAGGISWTARAVTVDTGVVYQRFQDRDTLGRSVFGLNGRYETSVTWLAVDLTYRF